MAALGSEPQAVAGVCEGQILAGKYRIERVLGMGGMGVVVAARHVDLDHKVALKFLLPAFLSDGDAVARFTREARAAVRITNEHVARVTDVGRLENGAPYMVMEFLEGRDLSSWLRAQGAFKVEDAVDHVLQACVGIGEAHDLGIVHRDLKPANLFAVPRADGQVVIKVLDFGISKTTDGGRTANPSSVSITRTSAVIGSPLYMSPEQIQNAKGVDRRTDIWSLGVVLYELLSGAVPFPGESFGELAVKISVHPPPSLCAARPAVPAALEAVILRCLEKDREARFADVPALARALAPFATRFGRASVDRISGIGAGSSEAVATAVPDRTLPASATMAPLGRTAGQPPPSKNGALLAVLGFGAAVLVAVATFVWMRHPVTTAHDGFVEGPSAVPDANAAAVAPPPAVPVPPLSPSPLESVDAVTPPAPTRVVVRPSPVVPHVPAARPAPSAPPAPDAAAQAVVPAVPPAPTPAPPAADTAKNDPTDPLNRLRPKR